MENTQPGERKTCKRVQGGQLVKEVMWRKSLKCLNINETLGLWERPNKGQWEASVNGEKGKSVATVSESGQQRREENYMNRLM